MNSRMLLVSFIALGFTACGQAKFSASKSDALSKGSVFGGDATGQIKQPGSSGGSAGGNVNQPGSNGGAGGGSAAGIIKDFLNQLADGEGNGKIPDINQLPAVNQIYVQLVCSDAQSRTMTNLKKAMSQSLPVKLEINGTACSTDAAKIKAMALAGQITLADIQALCPGALLNGQLKTAAVEINGGAGLSLASSGMSGISILYARNKDTSVPSEAADANCDQRSSPLVIHRTSDINNPLPIALSSREDGVKFDLLGAKNNYAPVQISWFTNYDYQLLTLPNSRGQVNGIDELFGDATLGPDGKFADNGYAALAKYDENEDGLIDTNDEIYSKLRLWSDRNFDGIAARRELTSLSVAGVVFIDLDFSDDFAERDLYGNETKMKSVVGNADGSLDLIFDLWFAY